MAHRTSFQQGYLVPKALVPHYVMNVGLPEADLQIQLGNSRLVPTPDLNTTAQLPTVTLTSPGIPAFLVSGFFTDFGSEMGKLSIIFTPAFYALLQDIESISIPKDSTVVALNSGNQPGDNYNETANLSSNSDCDSCGEQKRVGNARQEY